MFMKCLFITSDVTELLCSDPICCRKTVLCLKAKAQTLSKIDTYGDIATSAKLRNMQNSYLPLGEGDYLDV